MKTIGKIVGAPLKMLGLVKKPGKAPGPLPTASRDQAREIIMNEDAIRRRRGGLADMMFGSGGAEGGGGGKSTLGE